MRKIASEKLEAEKTRSPKAMLLVAVALSVGSLVAGYVLARNAFLEDVAEHQQEFIPDETVENAQNAFSDDQRIASGDITGVIDPAYSEQAKNKGDATGKDKHDEPEQLAGMLVFDAITTNISSLDGAGVETKNFLKINLVLVYEDQPGAKDLLVRRQAFIRDLFQVYLRSLTEADLRGSAGIFTLKGELLKRARAATGTELPKEILISDLIIN